METPTLTRGLSPSSKAGLRYEKKVNKFLKSEFEDHILKYQPLVSYGTRALYPDWLLFTENFILIIECKVVHSTRAYTQLRHIYSPAVKHSYSRPVRVLEICKQFDPRIKLPELSYPISNLDISNFKEDLYYVFPHTGR